MMKQKKLLFLFNAIVAIATFALAQKKCVGFTINQQSNVVGFSCTTVRKSLLASSQDESETGSVSRRRALTPLVVSTAAAVFSMGLGRPLPALGATDVVSNKVASPAALKTLKRIVKEFKDPELEFMVSNNDYAGTKNALRQPPLTELRRSCVTLTRGGASNEFAEELDAAYLSLIKSLEDLDNQAGLGSRGRKGIELTPSYDQTLSKLNTFIDLAEQSAALPVVTPDPSTEGLVSNV